MHSSFKCFNIVCTEVLSLSRWCLTRMRVLWNGDAFLFVFDLGICILWTTRLAASLACQNDLIAFTWTFNWHLIESKCDVNWHELNSSRFDVRIASHRCAYVIYIHCSFIYWENRYDFCYVFLWKSFFTISKANSFHETWSQPLNGCCLFVCYHQIGSDSTENKTTKQKKKPTRCLMLETTLIKINSFILGCCCCCCCVHFVAGISFIPMNFMYFNLWL